jgi:hypothetical protein
LGLRGDASHPEHQGGRWRDLARHVSGQARAGGAEPECEVLLRQAGSGDEVADLARDLVALVVGGVLAGALDDGRQKLGGAIGPGRLDGFEYLPRDGAPGIGADGGGDAPPVGQGAALDSRQDALERALGMP